jgi:hypothetical protein
MTCKINKLVGGLSLLPFARFLAKTSKQILKKFDVENLRTPPLLEGRILFSQQGTGRGKT